MNTVGGMNRMTRLTRQVIPRSPACLPLTPFKEPLSNVSMLFWERRRETPHMSCLHFLVIADVMREHVLQQRHTHTVLPPIYFVFLIRLDKH